MASEAHATPCLSPYSDVTPPRAPRPVDPCRSAGVGALRESLDVCEEKLAVYDAHQAQLDGV